jgi:Mlc titration factor MtfA (ptsG expression regulator)
LVFFIQGAGLPGALVFLSVSLSALCEELGRALGFFPLKKLPRFGYTNSPGTIDSPGAFSSETFPATSKDYLAHLMVLVIQIAIVGLLILVVILMAFSIRAKKQFQALPENFREMLADYVAFYRNLDEAGKSHFEQRAEQFLASVSITGVNAEVEDLDRVLIAAAAIIPVYGIPDWQYVNLHEILVYPGTFNLDFDQGGQDRHISGMVGTGALQHAMIITKWQLRQGFINDQDTRNTAIHEFVHLVDKMDGTIDGVPEIILERRYCAEWKKLMEDTIGQMRTYGSDIDYYATTNTAEFFAVVSEYFFKQPERLRINHPQLYQMLERIYRTGTIA